ncbi:MAG: 3'(2'),5'-bisphosphate nucleotidase CysQ [Prochlorococcus marinus CUG1439]|uniref:3'(2'),5'-bisphosphate nucleotidase CysQ n=1 Tax=Prochlorococcus sp. MIT 1314 TaxID=3096220 RepID=UPI001B29901B|nr:3'(2'),5'-bisphosphate nucleotidase CysQ [Prochlorococcus sp. MIT 1314]MCR8538747.1 3'(2'),5'-bisphosphate nucleotidase CysQ [Prochlorococcus marinus CUG1439]
MIKLPFGVDIDNLIEDLRIFSWEAAEILLFYSKRIKDNYQKKDIIKNNNDEDPVTLADLKVNELIIKRIKEKYMNINWSILSEESVKISNDCIDTDAEWLWILDPLDGTKDFVQGTKNYAMHLALNYNQKPILGVVLIPERDELWIAHGDQLFCENKEGLRKKINISEKRDLKDMSLVTSKNHRNEKLKELIYKINFKKIIVMGSIGCKVASIIRGESDIYMSLSMPGQSSPKDWDFASPEAILKAAGGAITTIYNEELIYNSKSFEHPGIIIASNNKNNHKSVCNQVREIIKKNNIYPI